MNTRALGYIEAFAGKSLARARSGVSAPHRIPVYFACTIVSLLINYVLGKDMAWDMLNYHLYAGFSALNDRFSQDYFAAGPQSYFNPYAYAPFYLLVRSGLSSVAVSSSLALVHSAILWLTFELALLICPFGDRQTRLWFGLCAIAMALVNPILIQQIGSSFADITTGEIVLAGWLLLVSALRTPGMLRIGCAALLLGTASALKPTNLIPALAAFPILFLLPVQFRVRLSQVLAFALAFGAGLAIAGGFWSFRLERMFGNPVFPLLNGIFRSAEFTIEPLRQFRFIPDTIAEALWRPFAMADPVSMVHEELSAPDIRYAVLLVLLGIAIIRYLWTRRYRGGINFADANEAESARMTAALACAFAVDWMAWISSTGNSRYFLPASNVAAVLLVSLIFRLFQKPKPRIYFIAIVLAVQSLQLWTATDFRWSAMPWNKRWIEILVPDKLSSEPALYFTMGGQSNSFIAPYLPMGAGFINFSGGYALSSQGIGGARIQAAIRGFAPHLRVLFRGERLYRDDEHGSPRVSQVDSALNQFGLRSDPDDCDVITLHGFPAEPEFIVEGTTRRVIPSSNTLHLLTCRLIPTAADAELKLRRQVLDSVLNNVEDSCPLLFQPRRPNTDYGSYMALRSYSNTDITLWVSNGSVKFRQAGRGDETKYLGSESLWTQAAQKLNCGRSKGHFFANTVESNKDS